MSFGETANSPRISFAQPGSKSVKIETRKTLPRITHAIALVVLLSIPGIQTASADNACEARNAKYRMIDEPAISAGLVPVGKYRNWLSDLAFYVHSDVTNRTLWFLFDQGSGAYIHLIATSDPTVSGWLPPDSDNGSDWTMPSMEFYSANRKLHFSFELPKSGSKAPFYILLPALTDTLRHSTPREDVPVAFFQLEDCGR